MTEGKKDKVFSKQSIVEKQKFAKEEYEKKVIEMRQTFERVASTEDGEKVLRYLFLLSGGDLGSVRRDKEGMIDPEETLVTLGAKSVWETIRYNISSQTLMKIERHNWED